MNETIFILSAEDANEAAKPLMYLANLLIGDREGATYWPSKPAGIKEGFFKVNKLLQEESPGEIELDISMVHGMQWGIIYALAEFKRQTDEALKENPGERADTEEEKIEFYNNLKQPGTHLLLQLTRAAGYNELPLKILEEVFGVNTGTVRPLTADNKEEIVHLTWNENNSRTIEAALLLLKTLETMGEHSPVADRFLSHAFMNLKDYEEVKSKLKKLKTGTTLHLTLRDAIVLYWMIDLSCRIFLTPIGDEVEKTISVKERDKYLDARNSFLQTSADFLSHIRKSFHGNNMFQHHVAKTNEWVIE